MSLLDQLDTVLKEIDSVLENSVSAPQSNVAPNSPKRKFSKRHHPHQTENSPVKLKSEPTVVPSELELKSEEPVPKKKAQPKQQQAKKVVGADWQSWAVDPKTQCPIDPATDKAVSKKQFKKMKKQLQADKGKAAKLAAKQEEHERILQEKLANAVTIKEDPSLPQAQRVSVGDLFGNPTKYTDQRVELQGWVHFVRQQKHLMFVDLRDGTGLPPRLQCVFEGDLSATRDAILLNREATLMIRGSVVPRQPNKKDERPLEIKVDYYEVIGASSPEVETIVNKDSAVPQLFDQRHWVLRNERNSLIMRMRCHITQAFRQHFYDKDFIEVTPPTLVQTQVEGGSTLFKLNYFEEEAYLTQSSQLYLETAMPAVGNCFCVMPSYRAEKSHTRRHLAEFTHLEGEMPFIKFEDLLDYLEDMVVDVCDRVMKQHGDLLKKINPKFVAPKKPFLRMTHEDAIRYCQEHNILNEDTGKAFQQGEDISEKPERAMTDQIGKPIFLIKFPADIKSFYMSRDAERPDLTESVDLLMPYVGEIVGGSMREYDYDRLNKGFISHNIDPKHYYWYTDLRKYGTCPHGGFGLGLERWLCWMMDIYHIRDACFYPRYWGRCRP